jgi:head-tail adaptor
MSIGLTADELSQMRDDIEGLLPDTCNILSISRTSDGMGSWTETWGTVTTSVYCRIDFMSGKEALASSAEQPFNRAMLSLPYDTTITPANRIEWEDLTFNVISVNEGQSWAAVRRAVVEQVR